MKIKNKMVSKLKRKTVNHAVRICVDCGSSLVTIDETKIQCKTCGRVRKRSIRDESGI